MKPEARDPGSKLQYAGETERRKYVKVQSLKSSISIVVAGW
jgi:hypothetical protein